MNTMVFQLIALDMDGTLIGTDRDISPNNRRWIESAQQAGVRVVLATGRPVREVLPYAEQLHLRSPLIINNGSEIWETPSSLYQRHVIAPELIERIFAELSKYGNEVGFWAHTVSGRIDSASTLSDIRSVQWLQFGIKSANLDHLHRIREELTSWGELEISNSHSTNIECNPYGISKASGLEQVCSMLHISMTDTIAVGDSLNDIRMIRAAGLGVAMGNAQDAVKHAADVVAPSNVEDGVSWVIKNYLLPEDE